MSPNNIQEKYDKYPSNMVHLTIKPEFEALVSPISALDKEQLEQSIVKNGCLLPLVTWERLLTPKELSEEMPAMCKNDYCRYSYSDVPVSRWVRGDGVWCCPCGWGIAPMDTELILLDGHKRYEICQRLDIPFEVIAMRFDSSRKAAKWARDKRKDKK